MSVGVEALFTSALGLVEPWKVTDVSLDTPGRRIDFEVRSTAKALQCPACEAKAQPIHDRMRRSWRHLDFFQYEAWLHAEVPRVGCKACGKTTQVEVPWARPNSGFTLLYEALALSLCSSGLAVRQAAKLMRCTDKKLWRFLMHYVEQARAREDMSTARTVGVDETSTRRGQHYVTVFHDLDAKRLLFATEGRDHQTIERFAEDLQAHGGDPGQIEHVCIDMSAAYAKGVALSLPQASISYDRYHVVALANAAMDEVRIAEMRGNSPVAAALRDEHGDKAVRSLMWGMRTNPIDWTLAQTNAMHTLQRSNLKSARAWRIKQALREVYAHAREHNNAELAAKELNRWISWARRSRLEPFKRLGATLREHRDAVVRGMIDNRSNAFVEAMNGLMQQAKRAARGFRTVGHFIAIAYLRLSNLKHLPANPLQPAAPR